MKLKDITFEDDKVCICPKCEIPLTFKGWIPKKALSSIGNVIFLLFTPKSWIGSYYYQCDKCKHTYEIKKDGDNN